MPMPATVLFNETRARSEDRERVRPLGCHAALVTACGGAMQAHAAGAADAPAACENLVPVLGDSDPESGHERDRINAPDAIAADASPAKRQRLMSD